MTDIEAPIQEVTVYADRALITRRGTITLEAGNHDLRVNDLPYFIRESLRATGNGPEGTRILNVDVTTAFHSRPPDSVLQLLQDELEQLYQRRNILEVRQRALRDRGKWLSALGEQSRDFARGLARGQMTAQDCAEFFRFMAAQAQDDAEAAQQLEAEQKALQKEIDAKERELVQKKGYELPDRQAAIISLELATAGDFSLELSYIIEGASWHPQYDVRVKIDESGNKGEVELTYLGMVQQSTSERWESVQLSLSTARPSLSAVLPELEPWYLKQYVPPPPIRPAAQYAAPMQYPMLAGMAKGAPGSAGEGADEDMMSMKSEAMREQYDAVDRVLMAEAAIATATVEHTGTALVFHVGRSVDIPSDHSPHKTTIAIDMLPCDLDYVTAPILEENAHLRAAITNTTEHVLLKGPASIFLNNEYVGTTEVKTTASTEKFKIFLGIDDTIKVERKLIERAVDKGGNLLQSDIRRITYAYRITVHNYANAPHTIEVRDHLPVSQHERIKLKGQQISPQPVERSKLELLEWRFVLPADSERIVEHRFVVEHPQGMRVIGLPD